MCCHDPDRSNGSEDLGAKWCAEDRIGCRIFYALVVMFSYQFGTSAGRRGGCLHNEPAEASPLPCGSDAPRTGYAECGRFALSSEECEGMSSEAVLSISVMVTVRWVTCGDAWVVADWIACAMFSPTISA